MNNYATDLSKEILGYMVKEKIKLLYTIPYKSSFNFIEFLFR